LSKWQPRYTCKTYKLGRREMLVWQIGSCHMRACVVWPAGSKQTFPMSVTELVSQQQRSASSSTIGKSCRGTWPRFQAKFWRGRSTRGFMYACCPTLAYTYSVKCDCARVLVRTKNPAILSQNMDQAIFILRSVAARSTAPSAASAATRAAIWFKHALKSNIDEKVLYACELSRVTAMFSSM
jgi:hypothetical protein